ncbi:MAG: hypothetical protein EBX40_08085, partial [Gammaproteobacteria bacterium]|nr:hypothetical protein [Gammaproteobacteria bacterium]
PSPSGGVMVSKIEHLTAAWVHGFVMRRVDDGNEFGGSMVARESVVAECRAIGSARWEACSLLEGFDHRGLSDVFLSH